MKTQEYQEEVSGIYKGQETIDAAVEKYARAMNIKQIAEQLNFPEQFTFRKYFKQHTGLSPKAYREQYVHK